MAGVWVRARGPGRAGTCYLCNVSMEPILQGQTRYNVAIAPIVALADEHRDVARCREELRQRQDAGSGGRGAVIATLDKAGQGRVQCWAYSTHAQVGGGASTIHELRHGDPIGARGLRFGEANLSRAASSTSASNKSSAARLGPALPCRAPRAARWWKPSPSRWRWW
jgi:hypothetical protein